ncbi:hypothetical protein GCM10010915_04620 [Microbacterium faecale]|uniref:DUF1266 domain-containing protein n=1 Tax=Microbacterium faecale TaxID=1804630 RepID=A0A916Y1U1_9MICO|nr:hypothetical protein [Microbacterium faecale]GGD27643.1 hypothetical protein GCM10010915_04620 [Microbacterium faecale]
MAWIPRPRGDFDVTTFVIVLGILAVCLLVLWWYRRKKRNDPDRGGPGYVATATFVPTAPAPDPNPLSDDERWLLGFAAPRVVFEGLDAKRWDLGGGAAASTSAGEEAWERLADELTRTTSWDLSRVRLAANLEGATSAQDRAFAAVELAWWIRAGVATGHLTESSARDETHGLAESLRHDADDWLAFGDLLGDHENMARAHTLYRPGAPWSDPQWPRP